MNKMGYEVYSDSYLMSLTKEQIIELLRVTEHNFFTTEEALNNSTKAGMEIANKFDKAKQLLKAAVEDFGYLNKPCFCYYNIGCAVCVDCNNIPCDEFLWRYANEVEELIKGETDD